MKTAHGHKKDLWKNIEQKRDTQLPLQVKTIKNILYFLFIEPNLRPIYLKRDLIFNF